MRRILFGLFAILFGVVFPMQAVAASGTIRVEFANADYQSLDIASVDVLVDGQQQSAFSSAGGDEAKQQISFSVPEGAHTIRVIVLGKVSFIRDYGPIDVRAGKVVKQRVDFSESLGNVQLKVPGGIRKHTLFLFADDTDMRRPVSRIQVPQNGLVENVAVGSMWMVLTEGNDVPVAKQWLSVSAGQNNPIEIQTKKYDPPLVRVYVRSDTGVSISGVSAGGVSLNRAGNYFEGRVNPGRDGISAMAGSDKIPLSLYLGYSDKHVETYLLHFNSYADEDYHWCNESILNNAENWNKEGKRLEGDGRLFDALMFYRLADPCLKDETAGSKVLDLGKKLSAQARQGGHLFNRGMPLYTSASSSGCSHAPQALSGGGVCFGGRAVKAVSEGGSIEWIAATGNSSSQALKDANEYLGKLNPVSGVGDASRLRQFMAEHFVLAKGSGIESILKVLAEKEEVSFSGSRAKTVNVFDGDPLGVAEASLGWLGEAKGWGLLAKMNVSGLNDVANKRATTLIDVATVDALRTAIEYYEFSGNRQGISGVKDKASSQGYKAMESGETNIAFQMFNIAGDEQGLARLEEFKQKQKKQKEQRTEKRKKSFMQEQKSLEDELGF